MPSLGELFISLGFDVDDAKLKSFKEGLTATHQEMKRLGKSAAEALGIISGTVGALSLFVQHSADGAVKLNNMALMFGANAQAAQTFANALHQVNSLVSVTAGQEMFGKFSQMVLGQIPLGQGQAGTLALLGGEYRPGTGQSADEIIANLAKHYDQMKKQLGIAYGVKLEEIGLAGAEGVIAERAHDPTRYMAASQYNMTNDQIEALNRYSQATAEFGEAITRFDNTVASLMAPALTNFFNAITRILDRLPSSEKVGDAMQKSKEDIKQHGWIRGLILDPLWESMQHDWQRTTWGRQPKTTGLDQNLSPGIMQRLFLESAMRPDAVGDGGKAYGIAQWHPDRQALFNKIMGFNIRGSSVVEQEQFVNWELMHGDASARKAGAMLQNAKTEEDRYRIFTKYFERPHGANNITITVNGTHSPQETALAVKRELQGHLNIAHAQTNLAGY